MQITEKEIGRGNFLFSASPIQPAFTACGCSFCENWCIFNCSSFWLLGLALPTQEAFIHSSALVPSEPADTYSAPLVTWATSTGYDSRMQEVRDICEQGICNHRQERLGIFHFPSIMYREEAITLQKSRSNKAFERLHRRNPLVLFCLCQAPFYSYCILENCSEQREREDGRVRALFYWNFGYLLFPVFFCVHRRLLLNEGLQTSLLFRSISTVPWNSTCWL